MDVLITDIKMPVCSGIELLTIINERHYDCRSVVLSGYDDFNLVRNAMRLGASDYLLKPVDEGLLIHTLREFQRLVPLSFPESAHPENTSLTTLLQMQNILETLISHSPAGVSEAQHFLTANRITGDTCCLMCYVDIKRALYSNHLGMFQFFSDRVQCVSENFCPFRSSELFRVVRRSWLLLGPFAVFRKSIFHANRYPGTASFAVETGSSEIQFYPGVVYL